MPNSSPFTLYHHTEVVMKCYIDKSALLKAHAHVLRLKFNEEDQSTRVVMKIPYMVYHMQIKEEYMRVFFLTGL